MFKHYLTPTPTPLSLLSAEYVSRKKVVLTWLYLPRIKYSSCEYTHNMHARAGTHNTHARARARARSLALSLSLPSPRPLPGAQSCTRFAHRVLKDKGTSLILSFCCLVMVLILLFIGLFSQLKKMLKLHSLPKNFLDSLANIATNIIHCGSVMTIQKRSKNFFEANQSINNYS